MFLETLAGMNGNATGLLVWAIIAATVLVLAGMLTGIEALRQYLEYRGEVKKELAKKKAKAAKEKRKEAEAYAEAGTVPDRRA